jgi:hypothetical protein
VELPQSGGELNGSRRIKLRLCVTGVEADNGASSRMRITPIFSQALHQHSPLCLTVCSQTSHWRMCPRQHFTWGFDPVRNVGVEHGMKLKQAGIRWSGGVWQAGRPPWVGGSVLNEHQKRLIQEDITNLELTIHDIVDRLTTTLAFWQ